jgi:hypothetical protein
MNNSKRTIVLTAVLILLIVGTVWRLASKSGPDAIVTPTGSTYYHGVFRNKKDPNIWGDETGKQVPPPPDAIPAAAADQSGNAAKPAPHGPQGLKTQ